MLTVTNAAKHFMKINTHKFHVAKYCFAAGLYKQGITHDLSKFSPTEFLESIKYYQGDSSPILAAKDDMGYSLAWQHHKGRNLHHYEYWQDDFDHGGHPLKMPFRYALELVCDYLGAGEAYMGKSFSFQAEYDWWIDKKSKPIAMHPPPKRWHSSRRCSVRSRTRTRLCLCAKSMPIRYIAKRRMQCNRKKEPHERLPFVYRKKQSLIQISFAGRLLRFRCKQRQER